MLKAGFERTGGTIGPERSLELSEEKEEPRGSSTSL